MVRITIDEALREKLLSSQEIVELVDESGKLLGRVLPAVEDPMEGWEPITPIPTEKELEELAKYEGPGMTTDELLKHLRSKK